MHNYGMAVDAGPYFCPIPESQLLPFGLHKPVKSPQFECWHIEPIESKGKSAIELGDVSVDGHFPGTGPTGDLVNESLVYLMAYSQTDEWYLTSNEKRLKKELERKTNLGKTYAVAKAIKERAEKGTYNQPEIQKRAKDEKWELMQYMRLARWEIQKCYLVGDEKLGFWETLLGGPTPCSDMDEMTKMEIVPKELRGVVSQVTVANQCLEKDENGKCIQSKKVKTVKYMNPKEFLGLYKEVSLYPKNKMDQYEHTINKIIKELYEKTFNISSYTEQLPPYIPPVESGTYKLIKSYGEKHNEKTLPGVLLETTMKNAPVYASAGGKVVMAGQDAEFGKMVIIEHSGGYFTQYTQLNEILVKKNQTVSQAQLIGSFGSDTSMMFELCSSISGNEVVKLCGQATAPTKSPALLDFETRYSNKTITERTKSFTEWKQKAAKGEVIFMPGYNALSSLGSLSATYETSEKYPGEMAWKCANNSGDIGGLSCGSYQISSNTGSMTSFINYLKGTRNDFYQRLVNVPRNNQFVAAWKSVWESDKQGFYQTQHDFIAKTHYLPVANRIEKELKIELDDFNPVIKDVVWSTAVQHGENGGYKVFKNAGIKPGMSDEEIINRVYAERGRELPNGELAWFSSNSADVQQGVRNRLPKEQRDALARL